MRVWAAHAIFATILLGSLAARERSAEPPPNSLLESAVLRIAGAHGWGLREYRAISGMTSRLLVFEAPGCSQPVIVSLRLSTFEDDILGGAVPQRGYTRHYLYFDRSWDTPHPRAAAIQQMKYAALAKLGLTDYAPSWYLLLVEAPSDCRAAADMDWRSVWRRDYLATRRIPPLRPISTDNGGPRTR
jgi:hypothetical protein